MKSTERLEEYSVGRMAERFKAAVLKTRCRTGRNRPLDMATAAISMAYSLAQDTQAAHLRQQKRFRVVTFLGTT